MRPTKLLAGGVLTASLALVALPGIAASQTPAPPRSTEAATFQMVLADATQGGSSPTIGSLDDASASAAVVGTGDRFVEPGSRNAPPTPSRARPGQPPGHSGFDWKPARYSLSGIATFYDNGTTAMRLPRGTVIRVCGPGGCLERTVSDYGPFGAGRIIDMYRPDFFQVCGCAGWMGTADVTVYVY